MSGEPLDPSKQQGISGDGLEKAINDPNGIVYFKNAMFDRMDILRYQEERYRMQEERARQEMQMARLANDTMRMYTQTIPFNFGLQGYRMSWDNWESLTPPPALPPKKTPAPKLKLSVEEEQPVKRMIEVE